MTTSLVITAIGPDQPGIVEAISSAGQRVGANWAGSRMASLAGQFAGMVHFEVAEAKAAALEEALRALESRGLRILIARGGGAMPRKPARVVHLELVGHDRPGIVHELSESLASRGVSIEELHTQVASAAMAGGPLFKVRARLSVPASLSDSDLRHALESLANEMMVDLELDEAGAG
jgi:glycine cleavage system regulatory protein